MAPGAMKYGKNLDTPGSTVQGAMKNPTKMDFSNIEGQLLWDHGNIHISGFKIIKFKSWRGFLLWWVNYPIYRVSKTKHHKETCTFYAIAPLRLNSYNIFLCLQKQEVILNEK